MPEEVMEQETFVRLGLLINGVLGAGILIVFSIIISHLRSELKEMKAVQLRQQAMYDENFLLRYIRKVFEKNAALVSAHNRSIDEQDKRDAIIDGDEKWNDDNGLWMLRSLTIKKGYRKSAKTRVVDPELVSNFIKGTLKLEEELDDLFASLEYLVKWDMERAGLSDISEQEGFQCDFKGLMHAFLPNAFFLEIHNLGLLSHTSFSVKYKNLAKFIMNFSDEEAEDAETEEVPQEPAEEEKAPEDDF
jgi:hypothetical protein